MANALIAAFMSGAVKMSSNRMARARRNCAATSPLEIVEPPCRIFSRYNGHTVCILHAMRSERVLRKQRLARGVEKVHGTKSD